MKSTGSQNDIQGGSNMTGTNCNLFTHNQSDTVDEKDNFGNLNVEEIIILKILEKQSIEWLR
jgi:hypothetical protein